MSVKKRALRFEIRIALRYRLEGKSEWRKGTTENISRTGVRFRGEEFAEPSTPLEMSLTLPNDISGLRSAEVVCRGIVVRSERPSGAEALPALATTISYYRLVRP